jgi:hypothetical protein
MNKGMLATMIDNVLQGQNIPNLSSISRFTCFQSKYEPYHYIEKDIFQL